MRVDAGSITSRWKPRQMRLVELARECTALRSQDLSEEKALAEAAQITPVVGEDSATRPGDVDYFIGKCLFDRRDRRALIYLRQSTRARPWHLRAWTALA